MPKNLIESEDEDLLRIGCEATMLASLEALQTGANFETYISCEADVHDFIWAVVNRDGFMDSYLKEVVIPKLKSQLTVALKSKVDVVSMEIPIGKNFFCRSMVLDEDGIPYKPEAQTLRSLLNTAPQQVWRWSRRMAKSFTMKQDMLYHSIFEPHTYSLYLCQSWDVSKEHLEEVEKWIYRNPLIFKFTGGEPSWSVKRKWSASNLLLMNGSKMSCRSSTLARKLSGKSPNRLYEDEKALYAATSHSEELDILKRGQSKKKKMVHIIASAPAGDGTLFEKLCFDDVLARYWDYAELQMCDKVTTDANGKPIFHNIHTDRITAEELEEDWYYLGRDRFMEQYMLYTMSVSNRAVPDDVMEHFFDRSGDIVRQKFSSELPCIASYDLGKSSAHKSVIEIGEIQENNDVHIINIIKFNPGHPIRTRKSHVSKGNVMGVVDTIPELLMDSYNIQFVIGDATGMGADEPFNELKEMLYPLGVPSSNIIGYKWGRQSEQFMGKFPLWQNLVLPRMQQGRIRCYFDEDFQWEMRTWQSVPSPGGTTTQLRPMKQTYSDDMITAMMQMAFVAFRLKHSPPTKTAKVKSVYDNQRGGSSRSLGNRQKHRVDKPRWRHRG